MDITEYRKRIAEIDVKLSNNSEIEIWYEKFNIYQVQPKNIDECPVSIDFEFNEVRVGICHVKEYYSDKYGKERSYNKGFERFNEILHSRIKRISSYKGNTHYRTDYYVEVNDQFVIFSSSINWLFPFWKKSKTEEYIQEAILKS